MQMLSSVWLLYFYPRPPRGGRRRRARQCRCIYKFLSTPSARRATDTRAAKSRWVSYFYPRPPRGGRPQIFGIHAAVDGISIHALREEGDRLRLPDRRGHEISIHALREEGDQVESERLTADYRFLSTPSARRATRTNQAFQYHNSTNISIHALREEGDSKNRDKISIFKQIVQHSARI